MKKQKNNLFAKIEKDQAIGDTDLPILSVKILELLKKHERLTISEIVEHTGANRNTLKIRLRELVDAGLIQRHGKGPATWYVANKRV